MDTSQLDFALTRLELPFTARDSFLDALRNFLLHAFGLTIAYCLQHTACTFGLLIHRTYQLLH